MIMGFVAQAGRTCTTESNVRKVETKLRYLIGNCIKLVGSLLDRQLFGAERPSVDEKLLHEPL
jgi:hypothetical protein